MQIFNLHYDTNVLTCILNIEHYSLAGV